MIIILTKITAYLQEFFHETFHYNIHGLGFLYRQIKKEQYFKVKNAFIYFNPKVADNYGRLINGRFNEPETHLFIDKAISNCKDSKVRFVEVGGNIGEFVVDYGQHPQIDKIIVFEPQPEQSKGIQKTIEINKFNHVKLVSKPVSSCKEDIYFNMKDKNTSSSGISQVGNEGIKMETTYLDYELEASELPHIFLIDVEGAEPSVIKGGINFIKQNRPLIIFEYNFVSKKYFKYSDIQNLLGEEYELFRLNRKGVLDKEYENAWNLVAINKKSIFKNISLFERHI
jgi:FkbM family methyltransferase